MSISLSDLNAWHPQILILGPGGAKGFLELGALLCFQKEGLLQYVKRYVGVSIGSIIALLLTAGLSVVDIISDATETNLVQDISSIDLSSIKNNKGLISNRAIRDRLCQRMMQKFGKVPSLKELYDLTGKAYVSVATNLDKSRAEYLSWETEPDLCCVDAALYSINITGLFHILKYKGCVYIDGAFSDPYPILHYDDEETDILGIYITTEHDESIPTDSNWLIYLYRSVDIPMTQLRRIARENSSDKCKHLELISNTHDVVGFTLSLDDKTKMIYQGYHAGQRFLSGLIGSDDEVVIYDSIEPIPYVKEVLSSSP